MKKVVLHPKYSHANYNNDLALLRLQRPVSFTKYICLPNANIVTPNSPNFLDIYFQYACRGRAYQCKGGVDTSLVGDELMMGDLIQFFSTRWSKF